MGADTEFDLAVIGAGINGAGIARDAALRGMREVVLEQNDLSSGTSAASSRLIHGGLRYLEYGEIPLVYESLHERRHLRQIAAHLVKPLRINIPVYSSAKRGPLLIRLGMLAYDLLSMHKRMPKHDMLSRDEMMSAAPGLNSVGLRAGARYFDAQVTFAERLVLENLLAARSAGATIKTYHRVSAIEIHQGRVERIAYENTISGEKGSLSASVVVNAAGPWVDEVLGVATSSVKRMIGGTKGSHIVVGRFDGAPDEAFYIEARADGRPFFVIPWNQLLLIGTTDIRYRESLDEIRASRAEIDYLLSETNLVFPSADLEIGDIHYAYAGIRPLPYRKKGPESAITRKHIIKKHRRVARGLLSIVGGKLTTYRNLAEQTVDVVGKILRRRLPPCRTHDTTLPGGWGIDDARDRLESAGVLSDQGVERILSIYGGRAAQLIELCDKEQQLRVCIDKQRNVLAAEVVYCIREEMATTLCDIVHRRLMLGLNADQGRPHYEAIAEIAASELQWGDERASDELIALRRYSDSFRVVKMRRSTNNAS